MWRGQTYTRPSLRPGKRTVKVRGYCRRRAVSRLERIFQSNRDMPF